MITFANTYLPLIKFLISYSFIYIILPLLLVRRLFKNYSYTDKIIFSFSCSNLFFILSIHLLSILKIYEVLSIYMITFTSLIFLYKYKNTKVPETRKPTYFIFHSIENSPILKKYINKLYNKIILILKDTYKFIIYKKLLTTPSNYFTLFILSISFYIHFKHSLTHLYLSSDDSYVHLTWAKYLSFNNIYKDGIYPYGFESIISSVSKLFSIYPYYVERFIGPLTGILTLLSIYLFVYSLTNKYKNLSASYAIFLYTVFSNPSNVEYGIPVDWWRNISGLSMEYSIIFILPGVYSLIKFYSSQKNLYFYIYNIIIILTLLIHPYSFAILISIYTLISILHLKIFFKTIKKILATFFISVGIGITPILIGFLAGKSFHKSSLQYVSGSSRLSLNFSFNNIKNVLNQSTLTNTALILSAIIILLIFFIFLINKKFLYNNLELIYIAHISVIILYLNILYKLKALGLPNIIDSFRIAPYLALFIVVFLAILINIFINKINASSIYILVNSLIIILFIISSMLYTDSSIIAKKTFLKFPKVNAKEYDDAIYATLKIKKTYQYKDWIIVAPTEQFQHSLGYGFHKEIWEFANDFTNNLNEYYIKNKYVFIFIEKIPLYSDKIITENDYFKSFPNLENSDLSKYYTIGSNRRIIEAKMDKWKNNFQNKNNSLTIFYDSKYLTVYKLVQDPYKPINLF